MFVHFKQLSISFLRFILDPQSPEYPQISRKQKLVDVGFYYGILAVLGGNILWQVVEILKEQNLFNSLVEIDLGDKVWFHVLSAIIAAPIFEEAISRLFLGYVRYKPYFRWMYYLSSLLFGWVHMFNYDYDQSHYLYIPVITAVQTFIGFLLGYVRIIYGFWYGVILHAIYNSVMILQLYWLGF
ncbi:CPBP family intramembrane glutamic endopeptidase [Dyadobacter sp. CY312]|uniref:CPBP family intramembrane glutamic endopeptidase n=1 Tax=Dyadobacter sp. CY312 TaxID=2907303 RepID=UPI001F26C003|nr:CPBP family intramembrane glutamic endopeptidase [Dyadobacter sp. CY312]MCE7041417.1 CPBP family intramembrane metalloprotease [Dyadobacter sp. CY312]